ncbi:MAG TPA: PIG-L deacetylase family protein [Candidatus Tectomicrobia bacterium]
MRLTAIMAHPDDAEIWAGGTIRKHVERGDEALIICMVANEDSLRGVEATRGAAILGAQLAFIGLADGQVRDTPEACEWVSDILLRFAPDMLITHWADDVHADHATTAAIVQRVLPFMLSQVRKAPRWWACDTYFSMGTRGPFVPDIFVDVTAQWPRKLAAIRAHQSQHPDSWVRLTERQCGLHGHRYAPPDTPPAPFYAEGFKRVIPFGYLAPVAYLDS